MDRCSRLASLAFATLLVLTVSPVFAADFSSTVDRAGECGVSSETIDAVRAAVKEGTFSESDGEQLLAPLLKACDTQLPLAPLEDKLSEGLAKRVAYSLIARALWQKYDAYEYVRSQLVLHLVHNEPELLTVLGEGVSKGVPRADVEGYISSFANYPPEQFLTGAHMTSLLGQAGFNYGLTRLMLEAGFKAGGPGVQWRYIIRVVLVARKRGVADQIIADAARKALAENGTPNDVAARLGFTGRSLTGRGDSN